MSNAIEIDGSSLPLKTNPRPDRRTLRTTARLSDALVALLASKKLEDISISEIAAKAQVSRLTFYNHFKDKFDLLRYFLESLMGQTKLNEKPKDLPLALHAITPNQALRIAIPKLTHLLYQNQRILRNIIVHDSHKTFFWAMDSALIDRLTDFVRRGKTQLPQEADGILATLLAGAFCNLIYRYFGSDRLLPEAEFSHYLLALIPSGRQPV